MGSLLDGFDPYGTAFQQDPHPFYDAMRAASPAWHVESRNVWFVTRHDLVSAVVKDTATFSSAYGSTANEPPKPHIKERIEAIKAEGWKRPPTLLTSDPPDHTRYRNTVARAFNARVIAALQPAIEQIVAEEVDRLGAGGRVDFTELFSDTVPVRVIIRTLALPEADQQNIKRWSDDTTAGIGSFLPDDRAVEAAHGVVELQRFMHAEIMKRVDEPSDDIISMLVDADLPLADGSGNRKLVIEEAMGILQSLIGAGNETTTKLFSEMMMLLGRNKAEWMRLKADPSRAPRIVEEALRLSTPAQGLYRVTTRDTEIEGVRIPAGAKVFAAFSAANRDPAVFPEPHRFIPDRPNVRDHLAFGGGVHFCIGAPLSRLESVIALEHLARRWSDFELSPDNAFTYHATYMLRGLEHLYIDFAVAG